MNTPELLFLGITLSVLTFMLVKKHASPSPDLKPAKEKEKEAEKEPEQEQKPQYPDPEQQKIPEKRGHYETVELFPGSYSTNKDPREAAILAANLHLTQTGSVESTKNQRDMGSIRSGETWDHSDVTWYTDDNGQKYQKTVWYGYDPNQPFMNNTVVRDVKYLYPKWVSD